MAKPKKPYPNFELFPHSSGQWAKKIRGKTYYFGKWDDWEAALKKFNVEHPYLYAGDTPPSEQVTLADVLNAFDDDKTELLNRGTIKERTYNDYIAVCDTIAKIGRHRPIETITPQTLKDLNHKLALGKSGKAISPVTHKRLLTTARMVFKFANEILGCNVKYQRALAPPPKAEIRKHRAKVGVKMFEADQLRELLKNADDHMKAIIYLGLNCGFGDEDCIQLTQSRIKNGFIDYARPKTGVARRCPLWKETQKSIEAISNGEHVFNGRKWSRHIIASSFKTLCDDCGIYKKGITVPSSLRKTFETVAKNAPVNQSAIDRIMGHERPDMSEVYNQKTFDKQLQICTDFVHGWLKGSITL